RRSVYRMLNLPQKGWQVLGADLNHSESTRAPAVPQGIARRQETAALRDLDQAYVRFGSLATEEVEATRSSMSALPRKQTNSGQSWYVRFSNRPSRVNHFQAIHHFSVDVAHGLALLFGLGTRALPSWDSKTRWNNLLRDLAVNVTAGSSGHTNSPHPSSREGHHSTVGWISGFLVFELILCSSHAAATSLVHRNSVP